MGGRFGIDERARVLIVLGTRPEAIKLAPVVLALAEDPRFQPVVCATGQHLLMVDRVLEQFGIRADHHLALMRPNQTPEEVLARALPPLREVVADVGPATVLVQGDTVTTLAASLAGYYAGVPVAHVEAGLRTGDMAAPFPEEAHRRLIAQLAAIHFAPTAGAQLALIREGVLVDRVHVTGNTGIDALFMARARIAADAATTARLLRRFPFVAGGRRLILVTAHRRENLGSRLDGIMEGVARIAEREEATVVFPVHPNPRVRAAAERLAGLGNVHLVEPLDYFDFVWMLDLSYLVLTDSGGVQEEAPALGRPVLVLRDSTERVEAAAAGVSRLVGTEPEAIAGAVHELLHDAGAYAAMARAVSPYGDGRAAERIVELMARHLGLEGRGAGAQAGG